MKRSQKNANIIAFDDEDDDKLSKSKLANKSRRLNESKQWKMKMKSSRSNWDANPRYSGYYKLQIPGLIDEWNEFTATLMKGLPVSFRLGHISINKAGSESIMNVGLQKRLKKVLESCRGHFLESSSSLNVSLKQKFVHEHPSIKLSTSRGNNTSKERNNSVWSLNIDSLGLSKSQTLTELKQFLHNECELGHLVRQEIVSMIPVQVLDVKSHHTVVDLCAAPGSKTEQVLTIMQSQCETGVYPTGYVIANDADSKRIARLRARYDRCGHPNLIITCSTAEELSKTLMSAKIVIDLKDDKLRKPQHKFEGIDRVLCDVPCSGDATFRKCPHLWRLFRPRLALELHPLQLQIALAGVKLLKPSRTHCNPSRFVYSTCSLNPIENEAVVAEILRIHRNRVKLLNIRTGDASTDVLGDFITRQGLTSWHCDQEAFIIGEASPSERNISLAKLPPILQSMHSPTELELAWMNLEYCMRVLSHDQDTGGFFVAVFESVSITGNFTEPESQWEDNSLNKSNSEILGSCVEYGDRMLEQVSQEKAIQTLSKLRYNPKRRDALTELNSINEAFNESAVSSRVFTDLPVDLKSKISKFLGNSYDCDVSNTANSKTIETVMDCLRLWRHPGGGMHDVGTIKSERSLKPLTSDVKHIFLMASSIHQLLSDQPSLDRLLLQAGIRVGYYDASSHSTSAVSWIPDADHVHVLIDRVNRGGMITPETESADRMSSSGLRLLKLGKQEFITLARFGISTAVQTARVQRHIPISMNDLDDINASQISGKNGDTLKTADIDDISRFIDSCSYIHGDYNLATSDFTLYYMETLIHSGNIDPCSHVINLESKQEAWDKAWTSISLKLVRVLRGLLHTRDGIHRVSSDPVPVIIALNIDDTDGSKDSHSSNHTNVNNPSSNKVRISKAARRKLQKSVMTDGNAVSSILSSTTVINKTQAAPALPLDTHEVYLTFLLTIHKLGKNTENHIKVEDQSRHEDLTLKWTLTRLTRDDKCQSLAAIVEAINVTSPVHSKE